MKKHDHSLLEIFVRFWLRHPLFWIGLHILLGTGAAAGWGYILLPLGFVLWLPYLLRFSWQRLITASLLVISSWWSATPFFENQEIPVDGIPGILYFTISQIKPSQTPFGPSLTYQGQTSGFLTSTHQRLNKIPCQIHMKDSNKRPLANVDYLIQGRLYKTRKGQYVYKPDRQQTWQPVVGSFSFAEWRFQYKRKVARFIKERFGKAPSSALFTSLATGDIDERSLAIEFSRLGLSHILAISGFHFTLLASFLLFCMGFILPFRLTQSLVLLLMAAYLFFLGPSPSAMRACCAISLALTGKITCLRSSGLNALGAGLAIILLLDATLCQNLGFQLSFLCTAALLLLYEPCEKLLTILFVNRTIKNVKNMSLFHQHGALVAALLRKTLALTLAVHIVTLPVCLFYFSTFPLLGSLIYNLFFPTLLSLSLLLLLSGCIIGAIFPALGQILHNVNLEFTNFLLQSVTHAPPLIKETISFGTIPPLFISLWLSIILVSVILLQNRGLDKKGLEPL